MTGIASAFMPYTAAQTAAPKEINSAKIDAKTMKEIENVAADFEAVFISSMLSMMWEGIETNEYFGGGSAEDTYRGMMVEEYGKQIGHQGGLGLADSIKQALIDIQEAQSATR